MSGTGAPIAPSGFDADAGTQQKGGDTKVNDKATYFRRQGQTRNHTCHWTGCDKQVPPAMWGCKAHWFRLPKQLRDRIWDTYEIGQEVSMRPSREYVAAARDVQAWIASVTA